MASVMADSSLPTDCSQPPPPDLLEGIARFNRGEYHPCHEILEALWKRTPGAHRKLYQGVIQLAIALHHTRNGNYAGASTLFERSLALLEPFSPTCQRVDVTGGVAQGRRAQAELLSLGPTGITRFNWANVPKITIHNPSR